jgi:hypothetical protein
MTLQKEHSRKDLCSSHAYTDIINNKVQFNNNKIYFQIQFGYSVSFFDRNLYETSVKSNQFLRWLFLCRRFTTVVSYDCNFKMLHTFLFFSNASVWVGIIDSSEIALFNSRLSIAATSPALL